MDQIKPDITARIQELKAYAEKAKIKLTPEIDRFIRDHVQAVQDKLAKGEKLTLEDLAFMKQAEEMVETEKMIQLKLKQRFESHPERHQWIKWAEVEKALRANPGKGMALKRCEETGGEPDVVAVEKDCFVFVDCVGELPIGRRKLNYEEAKKMALDLGAELMDDSLYTQFQEVGRFDPQDSKDVEDYGVKIWLKTSEKAMANGMALVGARWGNSVAVNGYNLKNRGVDFGLRCAVRVPKT